MSTPVTTARPATPSRDQLHTLVSPIGRRIRDERRRQTRGWAEVARAAGLRPRNLYLAEAGGRALTPRAVRSIARALGVDEEVLYPAGRPETFWTGIRVPGSSQRRPAPVRLAAAA